MAYLASRPDCFTIVLHSCASSSLIYLYSTSDIQQQDHHQQQHDHQVFQIPHIQVLFPIPLPADFQQPPSLMQQDADQEADPDAFDNLAAAADYVALDGGGGGGEDILAATTDTWGDTFPVQTDFTWT